MLDRLFTHRGRVMSEENNLQKLIERSFRDPIAAILLKNSNITSVQYESLIIDYLSDYMIDYRITYKNKALLRSKKVSRGSFSRTLSQARKNIISSIYTILLLVYIGIFDTVPFDDYRNLSEKLMEYLALIKNSDVIKSKHFLQRIEKELMDGISSLSDSKSLKNM